MDGDLHYMRTAIGATSIENSGRRLNRRIASSTYESGLSVLLNCDPYLCNMVAVPKLNRRGATEENINRIRDIGLLEDTIIEEQVLCFWQKSAFHYVKIADVKF
ncbi:unnamed protein product [Cuscuta europaea]|uniref:Uncharacterized protein n=1 Tax=Cuscuta europaea TaxID=41803 RepID=A0A9P1E9H6_CUSEU|nr:unnamed protein product [Cuscuta europaea]